MNAQPRSLRSRTRKSRPVIFAMYVAQAAIADAHGSIDGAIALMRAHQRAAAASRETTKIDLCVRTIDLLRFAKNPHKGCPQSASILLERFAAEIEARTAALPLPV